MRCLSFPGQPLDLDAQEAFTRQFGDVRRRPVHQAPARPPAHIWNCAARPMKPPPISVPAGTATGAFSANRRRRPSCTARSSRQLAATRCLPIAPPPMMRCRRPSSGCATGSTALHSARLPYGRDGVYAHETARRTMQIVTGEAAEAVQAHPLVRIHPVTGRRALYCSPVYTIGHRGHDPRRRLCHPGLLVPAYRRNRISSFAIAGRPTRC